MLDKNIYEGSQILLQDDRVGPKECSNNVYVHTTFDLQNTDANFDNWCVCVCVSCMLIILCCLGTIILANNLK